MQTVPALDPVHRDDLIKDAVEGAPGGVKDRTGSLIHRNSGEEKGRVAHLDCSDTFGVTMTTMLRVVPWRLKLLATTTAPMQ